MFWELSKDSDFVRVVALRYQHHTTYILSSVDNGVPQLSQSQSSLTTALHVVVNRLAMKETVFIKENKKTE